jgi:hypothetical protein
MPVLSSGVVLLGQLMPVPPAEQSRLLSATQPVPKLPSSPPPLLLPLPVSAQQ